MREFGIGTSTVQWLTTAYLLVLAAVIPSSSYLNRRIPTKKIFLVAIGFYIVGIICGATAQSFPVLLLGRMLEGVGTGMALPLMFNIISEQAPLKNMGFMIGVGSLVTALAPAIGPSLGGWIAETFGWRWIFLCLLPLLGVALVLGMFSIRQSHEVVKEKFDLVGWALLVLSFIFLIFAVNQAGSIGWMHPISLGLLGAFGIFIAMFSLHCQHLSKKGVAPLISLEVFSKSGFCLSVVSLVLMQFTILGLSFLIPNYFQLVVGTGATVAGSILLPGCALGAVLAPISGKILDRFGAARPILAGSVAVIVGVSLLFFSAGSISVMQAIGIYLIFTFGQGLVVGNTMTTGLSLLESHLKSDGNAVINTLQQLAGALGTSVVTSIVAASQNGAQDFATATMLGCRNAYLLLVVLLIVLFVCEASVVLRGRS
jgi:EmrB/QacA subfamily drug resistance transporter